MFIIGKIDEYILLIKFENAIFSSIKTNWLQLWTSIVQEKYKCAIWHPNGVLEGE